MAVTKILKESWVLENYSPEKIKKALIKANKEIPQTEQATEQEIEKLVTEFEASNDGEVSIATLENFIEHYLTSHDKLLLAKQYIIARYQKSLEKKENSTDDAILWLVANKNRETAQENSNKDSRITPTQRDLIAWEVSKDISMRILLPENIKQAHKNWEIHFHDLDYFLHPNMTNCQLVNIKDMFENWTVMNGKLIETPKSFQVACTVMTQVIAAVASSQYWGQTLNVKHLGKYLFNTKQKYIRKAKEEFGAEMSDEQLEKMVNLRLKDELSSWVQTIQYQINTLMGTNGQSPFVTLFLELDPKDPYISETAMIIEEILKQRIIGIKNEHWVYITNAFPKLVYVLDEHNNLTGWKYDYITELAVKCSAKRMYPDYLSAKKMREHYEENVFWPMWCVSWDNLIEVKIKNQQKTLSFIDFWKELKNQDCVVKHHKDINWETYQLSNVEIKDRGQFVECKFAQKNPSKTKYEIYFKHSSNPLVCTPDHPLPVVEKWRTFVENIKVGDFIETSDWKQKEVFLIKKYQLDVIEHFYDVTTESDRFDLISFNLSSHNCRSFLSPYKNEKWEYQFEGRFNQWVVSLNLPQIAIIADWNEEKFWELLEERLNLSFKALLVRHERLKWTLASSAPLLWQHWALARLKENETIDKLLVGWYSTLSLGYIGLYETTYLMKWVSHTNPKWEAFALRVMKTMREHVDNWKKETGLWFALYWTPAESLCYRFARIDKERFGKIKNVTDKWYYTNSYHVDVREEINAFDKLKFESQFQTISSWGSISYVEVPDMRNNLQALRDLVKFIYNNIQYAEFNTKSDHCNCCDFDGEIVLNKEGHWECPQCHNTDQNKMNVVRRTCFTKDNYVLTEEGYKSIADVDIGDKVLTKENRFMPVWDKMVFTNKDTVKVKSMCIDEIHCTPDHNLLVSNKDKEWKFVEPFYKEAKDLTSEDYLVSHINVNSDYVHQHNITAKFAWKSMKVATRTKALLLQNIIAQNFKTPTTITKVDGGYEVNWDIETTKAEIDENYIYSPVVEVVKANKATVYALTVVEDASYTIQNQIVKNCGYLGERYWNEGKTKEMGQRVLHLGSDSVQKY